MGVLQRTARSSELKIIGESLQERFTERGLHKILTLYYFQ